MQQLEEELRDSSQHSGLTVVSRLDQPTSGVLPLALGAEASPSGRWVKAQFAGRLVSKQYICLCEGRSLGDVGTTGKISSPLRSVQVDEETWISEVCSEGTLGLESLTSYEVIDRFPVPGQTDREFMLLSVQPKTGRRHQIRVHFASIGRPLVGDLTYGRPAEGLVPQCPRLFLHCAEVGFKGLFGPFQARAELPLELRSVLDLLAK